MRKIDGRGACPGNHGRRPAAGVYKGGWNGPATERAHSNQGIHAGTPSAGTLGYTTTTSYYIRCSPYGDRFVPATTLLPVYGYTPGYYRGYYTPLFYRY